MTPPQRIEVAGRRFVFLEETEYDRLCEKAGALSALSQTDLPALPPPDPQGRVPAIAYARMSLARDLIRQRKGLGLSQERLAELAGIRPETLSRLETGKHSASSKTVDKLMDAIDAEQERLKSAQRGSRR